MKVLVDTNVWSEAFRKKGKLYSPEVSELRLLIREQRVQMIAPIRMEALCGIKHQEKFDLFSKRLAAFLDRELTEEVYVEAARAFNYCRSKGVQGAHHDFVICACSMLWELPILTRDKDFEWFRRWLPIRLHVCR